MRHRPFTILGAVLVVGAGALYATNDGLLPLVLYRVCAAGLMLLWALGPVLHRATPRRIWALQGASGVFWAAGSLDGIWDVRIGPLVYLDLVYYPAYGLCIVWLALLLRHMGHPEDNTRLDGATFTIGATLLIWAVFVSPFLGGTGLTLAMAWAIYPNVDIVVVALAVQLMRRLASPPPALLGLIAAMGLQTVLDLAYAGIALLDIPIAERTMLALYLAPFFLLAWSGTHASIVDLSLHTPRSEARRRAGHPTALIVFAISPAVVSTAIPVRGLLDTAVRTSIVTALVGLMFLRLSRTFRALTEAERESRHRASHDRLTGLYNRRAMTNHLRRRLAQGAEDGTSTAVVYLDCDDFKDVNDTWGHAAGDTVLRDIATRLPRRLRKDEVLARYGGDEFIVVARVKDEVEAMNLADRVRRFFDEPLRVLPDRSHLLTPSIGVVVTEPGSALSDTDVMIRADVAMYRAKQSGRGQIALFDRKMEERTRLRAEVGDRLGAAVAEGRVYLAFQPVMGGPDFDTLVGWEALARWNDPRLGQVPPDVFISVAEESGLIHDVGDHVLREACRQLAILRRARPGEDLVVYVNVSPAQLREPHFTEKVFSTAAAAGVPPRAIRLEVTETMLVDQGEAVLSTLTELRSSGVAICIDDFGSGYASLATLLRLPVDCVKIDKALVDGVGVHEAADRQVAAVLGLVRSLGIEQVIAEGVETQDQAEGLTDLGCPMAQGWLFGRPSAMETYLPTSTADVGDGHRMPP